jgi:hypothetical protein
MNDVETLTQPALSVPEEDARPRGRWVVIFSFPVLMGMIVVAGTWATARFRLADPDTWWHVAVGRAILARHALPVSDVYSFTAHGSAWIAYEWFGEVLMAAADRLGGLQGLEGLLLALTAILMLLLWGFAYVRSRSVKGAFAATMLLLPLAAMQFTLRPQLLGFAFLLLTLMVLEKYRQGSRWVLWTLPPLFAAWVNTHGSFVLGLFVIALYWACGLWDRHDEILEAVRWTRIQRRDLELAFLGCVVALVVTPYGTKLAAYPLEMAILQPLNIANIAEWQALSFKLVAGKLLLGVLLLFLLAQWLARMKWFLNELALFLSALVATCLHLRFLLFLVIATAPVLARLLSRWASGYQPAKDRYSLNAVLLAALIVAMASTFPTLQKLQGNIAEDYPVRAVDYLRRDPPKHLLNDFGWGGYLIWKLGPKEKVFIDGRTDLYEYAGVFSDYLHLQRLAPDTPLILHKYRIGECLIRPDSPLATLLENSAGWKRVFEDRMSVIFVRQGKISSKGR